MSDHKEQSVFEANHIKEQLAKGGETAYATATKVLIGFRDFLLRGNVVDLAVAIVIGTAFTAVVQSLVRDLITPLIAAIWGGSSFSSLYFTVHNSKFMYGDFINQCLTFLIICAVVYFIVVLPVNALLDAIMPTAPKVLCPECLEEIKKGATRCKWCTTHIDPADTLAVPNQKEVPVKPGQAAPVPAERQAAAEKPTPAATPAAMRAPADEKPLGAAEKQPGAAARGTTASGTSDRANETKMVGNDNV
ncbi:probable large-conductance mechanosensitive channel at N-terminal half [Coccomyxa sp. Obi]|nr:probable large-conductance mechanosensitive channel at N-terminal half [Coccomyxa sp. Obi]